MADDPPKLTIAASNDEAELAKQDALEQLRWPAREMAANLLRVTRGAGKPHYLPQQIIDLSELILEASKLSNAWGIWSVIEEELHSAIPGDSDGFIRSEGTIVRGALQLVASNLVHQSAHAAAGGREIEEGIARVERERERAREEYQAGIAAARAAIKAVRRELKGPAKPKAKKPSTPPQPKTTVDFMRKRARELGKGPPK